MSFLYCTADSIAAPSGGGRVTQEESTALHDLGVELGQGCRIWGREQLIHAMGEDPWKWDDHARSFLEGLSWKGDLDAPKLAHFYAGTFSETIRFLKKERCKISYTAAAHNVFLSQQEHTKLGLPFSYPHLTDPQLWDRYVDGYRRADMIICPSQHSAECMRRYGCKNIEVIPHGVDIPETMEPLQPDRPFTVGYLGAAGPDKGLVYLLQAWRKLAYQDAMLVLAGRDSVSHFVQKLVGDFSGDGFQIILREEDVAQKKISQMTLLPRHGGAIFLAGWIDHIATFYRDIHLYIQPSVTEGLGIEVLEAMAHSRAVLCSTGAGAADVVPETWRFPAANVDVLAEKIDQFRRADLGLMGKVGRELAKDYEWPRIRQRYQNAWKDLL